MDFGEALVALKEGKMVARTGWNGKNLFVFKQVNACISSDIVPKMQSLPQAVKDEFMYRFEKTDLKSIQYSNQFCIVDSMNNLNGWVPSASDVCATDWVIYR